MFARLTLEINNVFQHIYKLSKENQMIISTAAEKPLIEFHIHSWHNSQQPRSRRRKHPETQAYWWSTTASPEDRPCVEPGRAGHQDKKRKEGALGLETQKQVPLLAENMIACAEDNPEVATKKATGTNKPV